MDVPEAKPVRIQPVRETNAYRRIPGTEPPPHSWGGNGDKEGFHSGGTHVKLSFFGTDVTDDTVIFLLAGGVD